MKDDNEKLQEMSISKDQSTYREPNSATFNDQSETLKSLTMQNEILNSKCMDLEKEIQFKDSKI